MRYIYSVLISLAWQFLQLFSLFNPKLKDFSKGRNINSDDIILKSPIWVHCASVGEFEQARPLIELIKDTDPEQHILLSFFSPSGFNHLQSYKFAEHVCYAPFDTPKQVKKFLKKFRPKALLLIKYEFWKNTLHYCSLENIPVYSVSSIFREDQHFFRWYGSFFKSDLLKVNHFFVQNQTSKDLLKSLGIKNVSVTGDTRFDRVIAIAEKSIHVEGIKNYTLNSRSVIAGSTWPEDEGVLFNAFKQMPANWKLIIAPHEVNSKRIEEILELFKSYEPLRLSGATDKQMEDCKVLIIDSIGLLNRIYRYADICFIGGAFSTGLHNILEAAVWGKPIIHGPEYQKFKEADDLIKLGGSISARSISEAAKILIDLSCNDLQQKEMSKVSQEYVYQNKGASEKVISFLKTQGIF